MEQESTQVFTQQLHPKYMSHTEPQISPYVNKAPFYELHYCAEIYAAATANTDHFSRVTFSDLSMALKADPRTLLVLRTVVGFTKVEFAHSTSLAAGPLGYPGLSAGKIDAMEKRGTAMTCQDRKSQPVRYRSALLGSR
jgi:hypothetical protein